MSVGERIVSAYKCDRCGHEWVPRNKRAPKVCPECKSRDWNAGKR